MNIYCTFRVKGTMPGTEGNTSERLNLFVFSATAVDSGTGIQATWQGSFFFFFLINTTFDAQSIMRIEEIH